MQVTEAGDRWPKTEIATVGAVGPTKFQPASGRVSRFEGDFDKLSSLGLDKIYCYTVYSCNVRNMYIGCVCVHIYIYILYISVYELYHGQKVLQGTTPTTTGLGAQGVTLI